MSRSNRVGRIMTPRPAAGRQLLLAGLGALLALAGGPAAAEGILNAACPLGSQFILRDYKDHPINSVGRGHGMAAFVRGKNAADVPTDYMMLVWSQDSGKGDGGISFWNWNDPATWSAPVLKKHFPAPHLREVHSTPVTNMFGGAWSTWMLQAMTGFSVYDLGSVASPRLVTNYVIRGRDRGGAGSRAVCKNACATSYDAAARDYSQGAVWFLGFAAPFLYVAQADNGLNIYRFTNPADPSQITWVKRLDKSWFGHRVNQVWVMGTLMVVNAVQGNYGVTLLDISNPTSPVRKRTYNHTTSPATSDAYAWTMNGQGLYAAIKYTAGSPLNGLGVYSLNTSNFTLSLTGNVRGNCSTGGYATIQDRFAHIGLSRCYHKADLDKLRFVTPTSPPYSIGVTGADNDFPTPLGNAVFVGSDHHNTPGSMVLCHQAARDTTAPAVNGQMPANGATGVKVTAGIGLSFTDGLKPWTVSSATLPVRRKGAGTVVGYYSYMLNIVNFRPAANLDPGTTYEVEVTSGVTDLAGNGAAGTVRSFQTASAVASAEFHGPARDTWTVQADLQPGAAAYGDAAATIVEVPELLRGRTWIRPALASRAAADEPLVELELAEATGLHVCADDRDPVPDWLAGWTVGGGLRLAGAEAGRSLSCRSAGFSAGTVRLAGTGGMHGPYIVVIAPTGQPGTS